MPSYLIYADGYSAAPLPRFRLILISRTVISGPIVAMTTVTSVTTVEASLSTVIVAILMMFVLLTILTLIRRLLRRLYRLRRLGGVLWLGLLLTCGVRALLFYRDRISVGQSFRNGLGGRTLYVS